MKVEGDGKLLRIFIGESDHHGHTPLYQAIVETLREHGSAGATVLRGIAGVGAHSRLHTHRILRLRGPADRHRGRRPRGAHRRILPTLHAMVTEGMLTVEPIHIIAYRARHDPDAAAR